MSAPRNPIARHLPLLGWLAAFAAMAAATDTAIAIEPQMSLSALLEAGATGAAGLVSLMGRGLDRQPSMLIAGSLASAVPVVALLAAVSRALARRARGLRARQPDGGAVSNPRQPTGAAWIELDDRPDWALPLGELVRIGRSEDCDLSIASPSLAEIHAVIQRSPENGFVLFDVSADGGPGLSVNGVLARRHRLHDGDRIDLGPRNVVFRAGERQTAPLAKGFGSGHAVGYSG